ncbi:MAG: hypothetical protein K9K82_11940, partial [Desulfobacteraceae bacterium]|nr:hypothetical protein [Desulfobacteraceae bacterium]
MKLKEGYPVLSLNRKDRVLRAIEHRPIDRVPKGELCISDRVIKSFLNTEKISHRHRREFAEQMGMDLVCLSPQYPDSQF